MICIMPYPIIIGNSCASELTVAQLLLAVGIAIPVSVIICFFIEHNISDVKDWFKNKFRSKKEKK